MMEPELIFEIVAQLAPPITIPDTPEGTRFVVHVTGGKFEGPRLKGEVLASGGDWALMRPDGSGTLDVRLLLKTDDGELIYMTYGGRGKLGSPAPDSLQTAPTFSASTKGKYGWLNEVQAFGIGGLDKGAVRYKVYRAK